VGCSLVQEKYQGKETCDNDGDDNNDVKVVNVYVIYIWELFIIFYQFSLVTGNIVHCLECRLCLQHFGRRLCLHLRVKNKEGKFSLCLTKYFTIKMCPLLK
jgi:hypothetical protein